MVRPSLAGVMPLSPCDALVAQLDRAPDYNPGVKVRIFERAISQNPILKADAGLRLLWRVHSYASGMCRCPQQKAPVNGTDHWGTEGGMKEGKFLNTLYAGNRIIAESLQWWAMQNCILHFSK